MRAYLFLGIMVATIFVFSGEGARTRFASLFFLAKTTPEELAADYRYRNIRVLIVPGHDDETKSGARFNGVKEADINVRLAKKLHAYFAAHPKFDAFLTRDEAGYSEAFGNYFATHRYDIERFRNEAREIMSRYMNVGLVDDYTNVTHNFAGAEDALKLYGINKWANENNIDIVLHVHFNDAGGRRWSFAGDYTGFAVYIPERQLPNAATSRKVAESVFRELDKVLDVSDYPPEALGIVEDQELIAIGANASLDSASLLIEYGYIYESPLHAPTVDEKFFAELAFRTYAGVVRYFAPGEAFGTHDTALLPHQWGRDLEYGIKRDGDVLSLQRVLVAEGVYEGPITGNFLGETRTGAIAFQKKYNVPSTGYVGPLTRKVLNNLYAPAFAEK